MDIPFGSQIIAAILALLLIAHRTFFAKLLVIDLWLAVIVEFLGGSFKPNFIYYHIYILFNFSLIFIMYYNLIKSKTVWINISKVLWGVFVVLWGLIFYDKKMFSVTQIVGSINVGLLVFLYLRELLLSDKIINYLKLLPFWVTIGYGVFYLGSIPFFALITTMHTRGLFYILHILIVVMNVFIAIGIILKLTEVNKEKKLRNKQLS